MKSMHVAVALLFATYTMPAVASHIIGGAGGTLNITVNSGYYDPDGSGDGPIYDLSGLNGSLKFYSKVSAGVPRDYYPYGYFTPFVDNSINISVRDPRFGNLQFGFATSNYEPDPGQTYQQASFGGDADHGNFFLFWADNGYQTYREQLSYSQNGAVGSGSVVENCEDFCDSPFANFNYTVTDGKTFTVVPEPASWAMIITGFGLVGSVVRRRRCIYLAI